MKKLSLMLALFVIFSFISPVIADASITASPPTIDATKQNPGTTGTYDVTLKNTGTVPLNVSSNTIRIMLKDNNIVFVNSSIPINLNPSNFELIPGESKTVKLTLNMPNGIAQLLGIRFTSIPITTGNLTNITKITQTLSLVIKVYTNGLPTKMDESLNITPKIQEIAFSGLNIPFNIVLSNNGNVQQSVKMSNVQVNGLGFNQSFNGSKKDLILYPEDSGNLASDDIQVPWYAIGPINYNANLLHGYNNLSNDNQVNGSILIIPTWLIFLLLLGFLFWIIRKEKIGISIKIKKKK